MRYLFIPFFIFCLVYTQISHARYDETLPKGVRLIAVRQVKTSDISDLRNHSGAIESYGVDYDLDLKSLQSVDGISEVINYLKDENPALYDNLHFGSFNFNVKAKANVTGFGLGLGITDKLTLYSIIPYYRASVNVRQTQSRGANYQEVNDLQDKQNKDGLKVDLNSLNIEVNDSFIQSAIQNFYGYQPLGHWESKGLGDIELGIKYRIKEWDSAGLLVSIGALLPTGREDNPDIIQDFGFGTGHLGTFLETGVGASLGYDHEVNFWLRGEYHLKNNRALRPQASAGDLTDEKNIYRISPGAKIQMAPSYNYFFNDWVDFEVGALYEKKFKTNYESDSQENDELLESISGFESTMLTGVLNFSTVKLFQKKKFAAPVKLSLKVDETLKGTNVPDMTLYSMELRLFF